MGEMFRKDRWQRRGSEVLLFIDAHGEAAANERISIRNSQIRIRQNKATIHRYNQSVTAAVTTDRLIHRWNGSSDDRHGRGIHKEARRVRASDRYTAAAAGARVNRLENVGGDVNVPVITSTG